MVVLMDTPVKFDSEQEKSGHNKFGHYQFGKYTCVYCKSDDTEIRDGVVTCNVCHGKMHNV